MNDSELLRTFVEDRLEGAFAELVRRHQDMVYSVCMRRLGHAQQAQDAAQLTFLTLLRKAPSLLRHPSLGGWLHRTAALEARALAKKESNRQRFEQAMAQPPASPQPLPPDARLDGLDEALLQLRDGDRHAIVMRFFEGRSLKELGAAAGISDEAARKRVDRALHQLSGLLQRQGATACTVAALTPLLAHSTHAAPQGLLPSVSAAVRQAPLLLEAAAVATLTKVRIAALCALAASIPLGVQWQGNRALRQENEALRGELEMSRRPPPPLAAPMAATVANTTPPPRPARSAGPPPQNPLEQALSSLFAAESRQMDKSRLARMTTQLGLDAGQQETAARILATFRQKRADGLAALTAGKVTLAALRDVLRADLMAAAAFRQELNPSQLSAWEQFLAGEAAAFAESHANAELARLHALLNLPEPAKDAVFAALVARTPDLMSLAGDEATSLEEVRLRWETLQQREKETVEPLLDESQRPVYHQQASLRRVFVSQWLTPPGVPAPALTSVSASLTPVEPAVAARRWTTVEGRTVSIPSTGAKATVLIFGSTTCPMANGLMPELQRIEAEFRPRGIPLVLVQTESGITAAQAVQHARAYHYTGPVLTDPARELVQAGRATITPEAVVLAPDGAVLYRGRIDDRFREVGQRWSEPRHTELRDALTAILAGRPVAVPRAPAKGCYIE